MGCDIHLFVEVNLRLEAGQERWWRNVERTLVVADLFDTERVVRQPWYGDRNYDLFAILADVRNRRGIVPLSQPRGLPEGVSSKVTEELDSWNGDAHSTSWFTLKELEAAPFVVEQAPHLLSALREVMGWNGLGGMFHKRDKDLNDYLTEDDVRIVFWFDN